MSIYSASQGCIRSSTLSISMAVWRAWAQFLDLNSRICQISLLTLTWIGGLQASTENKNNMQLIWHLSNTYYLSVCYVRLVTGSITPFIVYLEASLHKVMMNDAFIFRLYVTYLSLPKNICTKEDWGTRQIGRGWK